MTVITWTWLYISPFPVWVGGLIAWPVRRLFRGTRNPEQHMSAEWQNDVLSRIKTRVDDQYTGHSH